MSATGLFGNESCYIDYSVDTLFTNIATLDTTTPSITLPQTYNAWTGAAGISSLTIKIGSSEDCTCYFNELRLWGAPVTPQPTLPTTIPSKTPTAVPSDTSSGPTSPPTQSSNPPTLSPTAPTAQTSTPSKAPIYYTTIWFDDMSTNNAGWGSSSSEWTLFGESFEGCFTGTCCLTIGGSGSDEWVVRSTDISSYSSIRLQLDISTYLLYYDSSCRVYYSYTSKQRSTKIKIHESNPISNNDRYYYPDTIIDFPSSPSSDTIWIWLWSDCPSNPSDEGCFWDNVYLKGILKPPTANPTTNPTNAPSTLATNAPTPSTNDPTTAPTSTPSIPSADPSAAPTSPSLHPSAAPTKTPTAQRLTPTKAPTYYFSCGTGDTTYCYNRSLTPIAGESVSDSILIQHVDVDMSYSGWIYIYSVELLGVVHCKRLIIDFSYERIYYFMGAHISVVYGTTTLTCGHSMSCDNQYQCISNYSIGSQINAGNTITITVNRPPRSGKCNSWGINAILNVTCNDELATAPTLIPTAVTLSPSKRPSAPLTTLDPTTTLTPSRSPEVPSYSPTLHPSASPILHPSVAPSKSRSNTLTITTDHPTNNPTLVPSASFIELEVTDAGVYSTRAETTNAEDIPSQNAQQNDSILIIALSGVGVIILIILILSIMHVCSYAANQNMMKKTEQIQLPEIQNERPNVPRVRSVSEKGDVTDVSSDEEEDRSIEEMYDNEGGTKGGNMDKVNDKSTEEMYDNEGGTKGGNMDKVNDKSTEEMYDNEGGTKGGNMDKVDDNTAGYTQGDAVVNAELVMQGSAKVTIGDE
eukprot:955231_1